MSVGSRVRNTDLNKVGVGFIDILFGLAVGSVFAQIQHSPSRITIVGWSHLTVALVLITLSYIGYHINRVNRDGGWRLNFRRLSFVQLALDVALVALYFLLAFEIPGIPDSSKHVSPPAALMEGTIIAVVFGLYVLWDLVELAITGDASYAAELVDEHPREKLAELHSGTKTLLKATVRFFGFFAVVAAAIWLWPPSPKSTASFVVIDAVFVAALFAYRLSSHPAPIDRSSRSSGPVAGWYPDPLGSHGVRYFDGTTWTDDVADPAR